MKRYRTWSLVALLAATIGSHQAYAGMSGTSARVQQQTVSEARASVQAPAPAPARVVQAPERPTRARREQAARHSAGNFDGVWAVASSPGCGLVARSAVQVVRGRVIGDGVSGSVDARGNVRTVSYGGGVSIISKGHVSGTTGSGTYEVSNGCTGTWVSRKV